LSDSVVTLPFPAIHGREVVVQFDGGDITSDAGVTLLSAADTKMRLTSELAGLIFDNRQAGKVRHSMIDLLRERIYSIASGYEDANDLDRLRYDPALKVVCGRLPESGEELASQPTMSRLENSLSRMDLGRMANRLAEKVIAQLPLGTKQVILDVDPTVDPCHGQQQLQIFNAFYDCHCYLPLLLFVTGDDGPQRLIGAVLRPGNSGVTKGLRAMLRKIVQLLRRRLPGVKIILRGDSGFGVSSVIQWCKRLSIDFVLCVPSNKALQRLSTPVQMDAALKYRWEGDGCREFGEFEYAAKTWGKQKERVIVKAEITFGKLNPRFVATSLKDLSPEALYDFYCQRGDSENRIKEFKVDLSSGRTSCHKFLANQARLLFHVAASVLMSALQESLKGTRWASAQVSTIRVRILKIGGRVVETCRKIWLYLPTAFPDRDIWGVMHQRLT
jgi:hypothetical protein